MFIRQVTRGPFRINVEKPVDDRKVYYEVEYFEPGYRDQLFGPTKSEVVWVGSSRIAFNNAIKRHGNRLLNIYNLETGQMVVGGK
jgi:hypothetical protein